MNPSPVISILMPVYNEAPTIERAVNQVMAADLAEPYELIVVDDGSTDGTAEILTARDWPSQVTLLRHEVNRGKGAAVRTALSRARGEIATIFDADLEYDPDDLDDLIAPIKRGDTNAAFGVRAFAGHTSHSFLFVLGNRAVTLAANLLFNVYLRDLMTCHKAVRTELFRSLPLRARGFEIEPEIAARLLLRGERIYEVPVSYRARSTAEGKKLTAIDGFRVLAMLLRCRLGN
jgi:glycosyltransferase involved in cell wall biosynthesis